MVLHEAFRARPVRKTGIGAEVRHGVTSGVSCETCSNGYITPELQREYSYLLCYVMSYVCFPLNAVQDTYVFGAESTRHNVIHIH